MGQMENWDDDRDPLLNPRHLGPTEKVAGITSLWLFLPGEVDFSGRPLSSRHVLEVYGGPTVLRPKQIDQVSMCRPPCWHLSNSSYPHLGLRTGGGSAAGMHRPLLVSFRRRFRGEGPGADLCGRNESSLVRTSHPRAEDVPA